MEQGHPQTASDGQHLVPGGLNKEDLLQRLQLIGRLGGQIVRLAPVLVKVVEFPSVPCPESIP